MGSLKANAHARPADRESLTTYLQEIGKYAPLRREDEALLGQRIRCGDTAAVGELVRANLRFVVSVAKRYQHHGVALSDLISEGNLGLLRAAERFDETRGVKFISYAVWWVRQAMSRTIAEYADALRLPASRSSSLHPLSLDSPMDADNNASLLDFLPDVNAQDASDAVAVTGLQDTVLTAVANLGARQAAVVEMYFGLNGSEPMTLDAIAAVQGVTRERVRQIRDKALSCLRKSAHLRALAS